MAEVKILLVDDHKMVRDGLRNLILRHPGFVVIGESATGADGIRLAEELKPDIVIMDISLPDLNGVEATRRIVSRNPETQVLVLSMHADRRFVLESLKAGATGYVLKDQPFEELVTAIESALKKRIFVSAPVAGALIMDFIKRSENDPDSVFTVLSDRDREVLRLYADGKSTKEIARLLSLSVKTIETYRKQIMDRLEIRSIAELTKHAIREGLTSL
ncbi:MAG: response regulator transcription factor [Candidatus Wallbacteria bacterium]|nr:response regulator transcription factor [Candidatus Wallbacteria bacterium]